MESLIIASITTLGAIGVAIFFVGSLISALTALGNKQYFLGILSIIFLPTSLIYCALNWDKASYPGKLVYIGAGLLVISIVVLIFGFDVNSTG